MKNFKLLLATTAILSAGLAMEVNAGSSEHSIPSSHAISNMSTKIHARATLTSALSITETNPLDFGTIINPKNNGIVVVTKTGTLGAETDSQVMTVAGTTGRGIHAGTITVTGDYISSQLPDRDQGVEFDINYSISFPDEIELYDEESGAIKCGVVGSFSSDTTTVNTGTSTVPTITYGGKLTLDSAIQSNLATNSTIECKGEGTATLVYDVDLGGYQFQGQ